MKKILKFLPFLFVLALFLSACTMENDSVKYEVGVCQLIEHGAHDEATQGFIDALNEALPGEVKISTKTAANEITACSTIINQFIAEDVDLILANATPALQVAASSTADIPILGTAITEYSAVVGLEASNGVVGGNVSGTSDLAPLEDQAMMVQTWFPDAKTVGFLYCSSEANSLYHINGVAAHLSQLGYSCVMYPFTDSNDLASVAETAANSSDVIFVPTDNTIAANAPIIDNVCIYAGVPVIGGDAHICAAATVASLSIDYYELGAATGKMAAKILTGESDISKMPIEYAAYTPVYNAEICADLGLIPPEGYVPVSPN